MRQITKGAEPPELRDWKAINAASPQNLQYRNLPGDVNKQVRAALLNEQGYLCAYTLRRLSSVDNCHIEHVQPQNAAPGMDLDYANMVACFPKDGGDISHGYGAPIKGGQPVALNVNFVSPHQLGCSSRFHYGDKGEVAANQNDTAALETIKLVKLDHDSLVEMRHRAIETHGLSVQRRTTRTSRHLRSAAEARRLANDVLQPDAHGKLEPFCIALAQVALEYASKEEARSQRLRTQHGDNHR